MKSIVEYLSQKPIRKRSEIYIIKDNKLILGIPNKGYTTYVVPGGKIEGNESPEQAAVREAKEELGISVKDTKFLNKKLIKYLGTSSNPYIQKNIDKYSGVEINTFIGIFDSQEKIKTGGDVYKTIELSKEQAKQHFQKQLVKETEDFGKEKIKYVLDCLEKL